MGAFPLVHADMSAVLPVDYLAKTIVAIMTLDFHRLGRDFDFLSSRAPTWHRIFQADCDLSGGKPKEMIAFGAWKQRALTMPLCIQRVPLPASLQSWITTQMKLRLPCSRFASWRACPWGDDYPAPSINEEFVNAYLNRMHSQSCNWAAID